jgi:hypothetical protein
VGGDLWEPGLRANVFRRTLFEYLSLAERAPTGGFLSSYSEFPQNPFFSSLCLKYIVLRSDVSAYFLVYS